VHIARSINSCLENFDVCCLYQAVQGAVRLSVTISGVTPLIDGSRTQGVKVRCLVHLIRYVTPEKYVQMGNVRWMWRPACRFQPNIRDRKGLEISLLLNRSAVGMIFLKDKRRLQFIHLHQKHFEHFRIKFLIRNTLHLPTFIFGLSQNILNKWIWMIRHPDP